jgi:hypothetical protein
MNGQTHLIALRSYTIKKHGNHFYVSPTAAQGTHRWSKALREHPARNNCHRSQAPT